MAPKYYPVLVGTVDHMIEIAKTYHEEQRRNAVGSTHYEILVEAKETGISYTNYWGPEEPFEAPKGYEWVYRGSSQGGDSKSYLALKKE